MNTRTAKDDSVFHQSRYASSPEFERGLLANLVAKRCALLDDKSEIELIWFIHFLSHQPGGLAAVSREVGPKFNDVNLEDELARICLDPSCPLQDERRWQLHGLIAALRQYKSDFESSKSAGVIVTALGAKVCEVLEYTFYSRGLTLIEGNARLGKSFAASQWCLQHPGRTRFVEVPPSNDDAAFFRALARGLGLGNFLKYKVAEIRERVESVLRGGDILLVLDESQRLWPQRNLRRGFPIRVIWVMTMANAGVPICMVSTPQFFQTQTALEKIGWNSAQLTGRISHFESLPTDLELSDLMAVAKAVLPEADSKVLRALAIYARSSARYLAAIDSIAKRARFIAMRDGRHEATTADVRKAMQESVIPADSKLLRALQAGRNAKQTRLPAPALALPAAALGEAQTALLDESGAVRRGITPISSRACRRTENPAALLAS
jgi:hypothetical protein